jgi:hypothetical protein
VAEASGRDDTGDESTTDDLNTAFEFDDEWAPSATEPPALAHTPSWRGHEPAIMHSLKWHDADGIEYLHVIRADDLEEALRHVLKVKLCIQAARMKGARGSEVGREPAGVRPDWCGVHGVQMKQRGEAPHT